MANSSLSFETRSVRGGASSSCDAAVVEPLVQSTTYAQPTIGARVAHTYSRASNPTVSALEARLASLEAAPFAVAFASGLAAETALFLACLRASDHLVCAQAVYGGTTRLVREFLIPLGIRASFVDARKPDEVARAVTDQTRLIFVETPSNPTLELVDIVALSRVAAAAGVLFAVDNTFLTAALQQPLELGADLSLYSTTKHVEGHNTATGGAIVLRDAALAERLRFVRKSLGAIQKPFDAWLTLRGIATLPLRLRAHSAAALRIAEWLESRPDVARVFYPGLRSHPDFDLAQRQHAGAHGGVLAFELKCSSTGIAFMNSLRLAIRAESLGAVETLVTHPASMTHADVPPLERAQIGISDGLVRLSVGLESAEDLIADLEQALRTASASEREEVVPCRAV